MSNDLVKNTIPKALSAFHAGADIAATAFLLLALTFVFGIRTSWVNGASMEPTLYS
jgi:signal peptidase I